MTTSNQSCVKNWHHQFGINSVKSLNLLDFCFELLIELGCIGCFKNESRIKNIDAVRA